MRLFTIDETGKLLPYDERDFKQSNLESDLEGLLENSPEYFFDDGKVLVIGRQVTTNLNSFIDLLGIDREGNTVAIELKRDRTPRETIAQLLEYASFIEYLDYSQLNEIFQDYSGEDSPLEDYHQQYFDMNGESDSVVSFNKNIKLVIVAQTISKEVRQTALFLRKSGLDINCIEFKYFQTESGEEIITRDFVVGEEEFIRQRVQSASLPKVDEDTFLKSLDGNGLKVFETIFEFAKRKNLVFRWGSKGFSLNAGLDSGSVALFYGYPPDAVFKQSIYTGFEDIKKKVDDSKEIVEFYKRGLLDTGQFVNARTNLKWVIDKPYSDNEINSFLEVLESTIFRIRQAEPSSAL